MINNFSEKLPLEYPKKGMLKIYAKRLLVFFAVVFANLALLFFVVSVPEILQLHVIITVAFTLFCIASVIIISRKVETNINRLLEEPFKDDENAEIFRKICEFDSGPIAIVASAVPTKPESEWAPHFRYLTGSGQFYGLSYLLPVLLRAYREREFRMFLAPDVEHTDLDDFNVIILGACPTNRHTEDFMEELKSTYDIPLEYEYSDTYQKFSIHLGSGANEFKVALDDDARGNDYGVIIKYRRPNGNRKVMFLIGGSTSGTEAAAKFLSNDERKSQLEGKNNFVCVVKTKVENHKATLISMGPVFSF